MQDVQNKKIQLSDHFTYEKLIRFALPSIIIMIFSACYGIVDGYFVSKYIGTDAFAAINLIIPYVQIISGMGVIIGADCSSLIARTLGIGNREKAGRYFTMSVFVTLIGGVIFSLFGLVALKPAAYYLGASESEELMQDALAYGEICLYFATALLTQNILLGYLVIAEKPKIAMRVIIFSFLLNIILDVVFIHEELLNMGIAGVAWATGISQTFAALVPLLWFASKRNRTALRFRKTKFEAPALRKASYTGMAEAISTLASSFIGLLFNMQLMKHNGAEAVAAYGVVLYVSFVFTNVYSGYSAGSSPIMGYHFGANRQREMRNVFKKSLVILGAATVVMLVLVFITARPLSSVFVGSEPDLLDLTTKTLMLGLLPFLFMWLNVYLDSVFSAIENGAIAAILTIIRVLVFPVICIYILPTVIPEFWSLENVWYSLTGAEIVCVLLSLLILLTKKKKFGF